MNKCTHWLGHRFEPHPAGYHFCRRCGGYEAVAMSLLNLERADEVKTYNVTYDWLRAAECETGASPPAQHKTEPRGGGRGSAFSGERSPQ